MEQANKEANQGNLESAGSATGDTTSSAALQAAKISFWNYVAFSTIGFIALGPLSYLLADRNEWYVLLPAALFVAAWNFHRSMRGAVMTGLLWAGLAFLLLVGQFGTPYHFVKEEIRQLTDPVRLAQIAENHPKKLVRREAIWNKNLQDEPLFLRVATKDPNSEVLTAAVSRIETHETLIHLALNGRDPHVRRDAVGKISDIETLKRVRDNDKVWWVRSAAKSRVNELTK